MTPYPLLPYSHTGLKVFEAVARLLSFTLAANELHVTQSAVSRQVKQLEEDLDTPLVIRKHRAIELTLKGQALYAVLKQNFQGLEALFSSWQEFKQKRIVIKAALSYATRCLIPKFHLLNERYPQYDIVVLPETAEEQGINKGDYDLLVFDTRQGAQYYGKTDFELLREEYMAPVYTAQLAPVNNDLEAVLSMPRIHPTLDRIDWENWLNNIEKKKTDKVRETTFFTLDLALSACLAGQGATVTDLLLVLPELAQGFLSAPIRAPVHYSPWQYYIHCRTKTPIVLDILDFLKAEAEKDIAELQRLAKNNCWCGVLS